VLRAVWDILVAKELVTVQGGLTEALAFLKKFVDEAKAAVPEGSPWIDPAAQKLFDALDGALSIEVLTAMFADVFTVLEGNLGPPDPGAGSVL
jgi:hypothetical protein